MAASEEMVPVFVGTAARQGAGGRGALVVLVLVPLERQQIIDPLDHKEAEEEGELAGCRKIASPADCLVFCGRPLVMSAQVNMVIREPGEEMEL
jgi:hypothetical protein